MRSEELIAIRAAGMHTTAGQPDVLPRSNMRLEAVRQLAHIARGRPMTDARMTPEDFEALRPRLGRLTLNTVEIARRVLVGGESQQALSEETGLTRQRVSGMVRRVRAIAEEVPPGWEKVETWLPPKMAEKVRQMAAEARTAEQGKKGDDVSSR